MSELKVNGFKAASRIKSTAFPVGTQLFLGGFPPGMTPRKHVAQLSFLQGCVEEVNCRKNRGLCEKREILRLFLLKKCEKLRFYANFDVKNATILECDNF